MTGDTYSICRIQQVASDWIARRHNLGVRLALFSRHIPLPTFHQCVRKPRPAVLSCLRKSTLSVWPTQLEVGLSRFFTFGGKVLWKK